MRTTVVIDDNLIKEAMRVVKARTKREVIETALREMVRKKNLEAFREEIKQGKYELDLTLEELERRRSED